MAGQICFFSDPCILALQGTYSISTVPDQTLTSSYMSNLSIFSQLQDHLISPLFSSIFCFSPSIDQVLPLSQISYIFLFVTNYHAELMFFFFHLKSLTTRWSLILVIRMLNLWDRTQLFKIGENIQSRKRPSITKHT